VPAGTVPSLHDFTRHVWRYRDEYGGTVLCGPPEMFTLVLDDHDEADVAVSATQVLSGPLGFDDRVSSKFDGPNALVVFRDLVVLHSFLQLISLHSERPAAREVAEFCMSQLGFRWT